MENYVITKISSYVDITSVILLYCPRQKQNSSLHPEKVFSSHQLLYALLLDWQVAFYVVAQEDWRAEPPKNILLLQHLGNFGLYDDNKDLCMPPSF